MSQKPRRNLEPYLDAWFVLSEEAETVALATFPETSRLNHSCDPNAHVELPSQRRRAKTKNARRRPRSRRRRPRGTSRSRIFVPTWRARDRLESRGGADTDEELPRVDGPVVGSAPRRARRERAAFVARGFCACGVLPSATTK